ncbi:MAG TPA: hypothetical protein DHW63_08420 [Hyphomonadaceae bacterium]|nr:hypothetical protein [Hyphomonadaceae bacterium]
MFDSLDLSNEAIRIHLIVSAILAVAMLFFPRHPKLTILWSGLLGLAGFVLYTPVGMIFDGTFADWALIPLVFGSAYCVQYVFYGRRWRASVRK